MRLSENAESSGAPSQRLPIAACGGTGKAGAESSEARKASSCLLLRRARALGKVGILAHTDTEGSRVSLQKLALNIIWLVSFLHCCFVLSSILRLRTGISASKISSSHLISWAQDHTSGSGRNLVPEDFIYLFFWRTLDSAVTMRALDNSPHLLEGENKHLLFKSLLFGAFATFLLLSNIVCRHKTYHLPLECFLEG